MVEPKRKVRVLVVDDSALVRSILTRGLSADPEIEVVGSARDPYEARDQLVKLKPDVMTLDVEMPRMDGVSFLEKFMSVMPTPTVVLSSLTTRGSVLALQAMEAGAVEVMTKPSAAVAEGLEVMMANVVRVVKAAARSHVSQRRATGIEKPQETSNALDNTTDRVIALGASTGGVAALGRILPVFPAWTPGIVIVQHMPPGFTADFAQRLNDKCQMRVSEATDGQRVLRGHILVAPGGTRHCEVRRMGGEYRIRLVEGQPVSGHSPSVDVLFESLARSAGRNASACLLTGMGHDGAKGLLSLRHAGGRTFAQDRETSAVWGMPAAACDIGAAERALPLESIPNVLVSMATANQ
ncbi:MAG TPA: chemotaxis response regulator protein-glutamate methylesterase [Polyangiaceae bacterium]|nr:chemotaxis response regulator protein-glutamate methylesterase [Polyangiaceae bacterium]